MKLKREILEVKSKEDAVELADILLKLTEPADHENMEKRAQQVLLRALILAASYQGEGCIEYVMADLREQIMSVGCQFYHQI